MVLNVIFILVTEKTKIATHAHVLPRLYLTLNPLVHIVGATNFV